MGHFIEARSIYVKIYCKIDVARGEEKGFKRVLLVCQICCFFVKFVYTILQESLG